MSKSAAIRRTATTFSKSVSIDWTRPVFTSNPEVAAGASKIKSWVAMSESMHQKYQKPPTPLDFAPAKKKIRDTEMVSNLESFFKSNKAPVETFAMPEEDKAQSEETIAFVKDLDAFNQEFLPVLEKEIDFYTTTRTTMDTTMHEMQLNYPLIHEEIEDQIERREWFRDTEYDIAPNPRDGKPFSR